MSENRVSGFKAKGFRLNSKRTLQSIGDLKFCLDYRFARTVTNYSGVDKVDQWNSIASDPYSLKQSVVNSKPLVYSDGFGYNPALFSGGVLTGVSGANLKFLHDGTAHLLFAVHKYDNPSNSNLNFVLLQTAPVVGGLPGARLQIVGLNNRVQHNFYDDTGTLDSYETASNAMPESSTAFTLIMYIYYGSGGSNNSRVIINATQLTATTRNPTFGTLTPFTLRTLGIGSTIPINHRTKLIGAYNLAGKSALQIDAFLSLFVATLKEDAEYATLTTI